MAAMKYAEGTDVPIDRSKSEIEKVLGRYGADEFAYGIKAGRALVGFVAHGKQVRFILPLPDPEAPEFRKTATGRARKGNAVNEAFEAEMRRRWRALALVIKAKLEAVSTGIVSFEEEFLPYIVLPGGQTVAERILPGLEDAYRTGRIPALLPDLRKKDRD
jgi:hypothetical protein